MLAEEPAERPVKCEPSPKKDAAVTELAVVTLPEAPERLSDWLAASVTPALAVIKPEKVLADIVPGRKESLSVPAETLPALSEVMPAPLPNRPPEVVIELPLTTLPPAPLRLRATLVNVLAPVTDSAPARCSTAASAALAARSVVRLV